MIGRRSFIFIIGLCFLCSKVEAWTCVKQIREVYSRINSNASLEFTADVTNLNSPRQFEIRFYDGSGKARVIFYADRIPFTDSPPHIGITASTTGNVVVILTGVQANHEGIYTLNSAGFHTKCNCLYILGTPEKPTLTASKTQSVGESVTLSCYSTSTTTPGNHSLSLKYDWRVNNTDNPGGIKYSYTSNRDRLTVKNIVKEDAYKQIKCTATEDVIGGYTSVSSNQFSFDVYYGPDNFELHPKTTNYEELENSIMNMVTCRATCNPICNFTWIKVEGNILINSTANLNLGMLKISNAGTYRCTAERTGGLQKSKNLTLKVIYGPNKMVFNPNNTQYRYDESFDMTPISCGAECWECSYNWTGPNSFISSNDVLDLGPLTKVMAGTYTCTARNIKHVQQMPQSKQLHLEVRYGPESVNLTNGQLAYTVNENTKLSDIKCEADCFPSCTYKWTKNGQTISNTDTLSFGLVQRSSAGEYICRATNGDTHSKWKENRVTINIRYGPDSVNLTNGQLAYTVNENTKLSDIKCEADCFPSCTYKWTKNGQTVNNTDTLSLDLVQRSSAGEYICRATNGDYHSKWKENRVTINIRYGPNFVNVNVTSPYYLFEGDNLTVDCKSDCYPGCSYKWINVTSGSVVNSDSGIMHIVSVTMHMTGSYKCISMNTNDLYSKSTFTDINIKIKEQTFAESFYIGNNISQTVITVNEQDVNIKFTCTASGDPAKYVRVNFNGQILKDKTDTNSLTYIHETANCFDSGVYECEVCSKRMGISRRNVSLYVTCSPRPLRKILENITSSLNVPVTIMFDALAYPEPGPRGFTWFRERRGNWLPILSNKDFQISSVNLKTNLTIHRVTEADFGQYRVTTENVIGTYHQYLFLSPIDSLKKNPAVNIEDEKNDNSLNIGIVLGILCIILAIYAAIITIIWKRNVMNHRTTKTDTISDTVNGSRQQKQPTYANVVYTKNEDDVQEHFGNKTEDKVTANTYHSVYTELDRMAREKNDHTYEDIKKETHSF